MTAPTEEDVRAMPTTEERDDVLALYADITERSDVRGKSLPIDLWYALKAQGWVRLREGEVVVPREMTEPIQHVLLNISAGEWSFREGWKRLIEAAGKEGTDGA